MATRPDLPGTRSGRVASSWTPDDVMLYALAVGAGADDPLTDLVLTTETPRDSTVRGPSARFNGTKVWPKCVRVEEEVR